MPDPVLTQEQKDQLKTYGAAVMAAYRLVRTMGFDEERSRAFVTGAVDTEEEAIKRGEP